MHTEPSLEPLDHLAEDDVNNYHLRREKSAHITKAARSATIANILAPMLCIPMFKDEVRPSHLGFWLAYMFIMVMIRTWMIFRLEHEAEKIEDPQRNLNTVTLAVGLVGFGWGLGWVLMAPDLLMVNRMIYVYMTTAAMISSMFAYSVHTPTFYAFTLPIMLPSLSTVLWANAIFPWPFSVGLASLYIVVLSIARNFSKIFENSVRLRFRNERLYQELAAERDQSIAANVAKSKFIAVASHDLRQPMHAVNVYLELFTPENLSELEKKSLTKIKSSITTLNAMFDALLNISKLDADAMQVSPRVFSLNELVSTLRDLMETQAHNKGLALNLHAPDDLFVNGDKLFLQQIISNLLANAIQYTEVGSVNVRFEAVNHGLCIQVSDTGCGIAPSELQQIFSQFFRSDRTRAWHDGLGLGLSIVKRLCDLIGAQIQVTSEIGQGSTFVVTTPFVASTQALETSTPQAPRLSTLTIGSLLGKHIAVIEDNPIIAEAYKHTLVSKGAHVHLLSEHASELEAQLEAIDHLDCILCDFRLSQTTGDVLIEKIRESYNEEIPAIIVTADTSPSHIHLFTKLNVQVLHKPVSFQEIAQTIERTLLNA